MHPTKEAKLIREQALSEGVIESTYDLPETGQVFYLDLNEGKIHVRPEHVQRLVEIAKSVAGWRPYGEYRAISALKAERSTLDNRLVYWQRGYLVNQPKTDLISLGEWAQVADRTSKE